MVYDYSQLIGQQQAYLQSQSIAEQQAQVQREQAMRQVEAQSSEAQQSSSTPFSQNTREQNDKLVSRLNKVERLIRDVQSGKTKTSDPQNVLRQLRNEKSKIEAQIKRESSYQVEVKPQVQEASSKDVVFDSKGQGTSKALELQSEQEKAQKNVLYQNTPSGPVKVEQVKSQNLIDVSNQQSNFNPTVPRTSSPQETINKQDQPQVQVAYKSEPLLAVRPSEEVFEKKNAYQKFIKESEKKELDLRREDDSTAELISVGTGVVKYGKGIVGYAVGLADEVLPVDFQTGKADVPFDDSVKGTISFIEDPKGTVQEISTFAQENPEEFAGGLTAGLFGERVLVKTGQSARNIYTRTGADYVPPEKVFSSQVLDDGQTFPMTSSTDEALIKFNTPGEDGTIKVVTSAPSKLSDTEVGVGKKAGLGLEDSGVYVTPQGEGSPAFLRIAKSTDESSFSLDPTTNVRGVFKQPTVTEFEVQGVVRQPRSVVEQPGFSATEKFFEQEGSKTGQAYITKRSEIGQGELSRQQFLDKQGKTQTEAGTSELEAVIPYKAQFEYTTPESFLGRIKGFERYTTVDGVNVPIRQAKVLKEVDTPQTTSTRNNNLVTGSVILEESSRPLVTKKAVTPSDVLGFSSIATADAPEPSVSIFKDQEEYSSSGESSDSDITPSDSSTIIDTENESSIFEEDSENSTTSEETSIFDTSGADSGFLDGSESSSSLGDSAVSFSPLSESNSSNVSSLFTPTPSLVIRDSSYNITSNTSSKSSRLRGMREGLSNEKYAVRVKKKGKFVTLGEYDSFQEAFNTGKRKVEQTALASFDIVKDGKRVGPQGLSLPNNLRRSKQDSNIFVQKENTRISSQGEKAEISGRGRALRFGGSSKGIFA